MDIIPISYPFTNMAEPSQVKPVSIAIGHFDGVHRGHQNVIKQAVAVARGQGMLAAVMTFSPHPKEVLGHGDHYFSCLTPLQKKKELFERLGVDVVYVMRFDLAFAAVSPGEFVSGVLRPLGVKHAVVGFDFTFGSKGAGNATTLMELSRPDIDVSIVEPLYENGVKVSSTYTRESLEEGNLALVSTLLGRDYEVTGTVVHGDGRGRTIGFPTANLELSDAYVSPRLGVYAITAHIGGEIHSGVLNFGMKPTFNTGEIKPVMEAHLFGFDQDIYGIEISVQFRAFIRPEQRFGSIQELIAQIGADSRKAQELLERLT
ncbi:bifunctional riboflavin kinase/FAD synthetase [Paenibacillus sp. LHD-117]|uniref:bifunctional riboflavin kinase/FAD synthetase n=1 Tax=Paenibacillus sp. LHD-117 TaxID=3071412 RepID=UPI0027E10D1E|nr:bifunctional riboflavin kinase/FAD synthetase [Paenibacillus sp. LHD-117]MDQ6419209.1 bifunctional riboflavin kinase/FAD synthetase [Paenibacillus sp. LHD-117]